MRIVFLDRQYVDAAKAFGYTFNGSEGLANILDVFTMEDRYVIAQQTQRLLQTLYFAKLVEAGFTNGVQSDVWLNDAENHIFAVSGNEAERVQLLNCVATAAGELIFFEDEQKTENVYANIFTALSRVNTIGDLMHNAIWPVLKKSI